MRAIRTQPFGIALVLFTLVGLSGPSAQQPAARRDYRAEELLVRFHPQATTAQRSARRAAVRGQLLRRFRALNIEHIRVPAGMDVEAAAALLRGQADVAAVQPNYERRVTSAGVSNDPYWVSNALWGLKKIQADGAWANFTTGDASIIVADLDTGVDYTHPDLAANMWVNPGEIPANGIDDDANGYVDDIHGIDTFNDDSNPMDDNGHGTHTSGTIAAAGGNGLGVVGVSWKSKIIACKFLDGSGSGYDSGAIECFDYLVHLKRRGVNVRVTSNSWGSLRAQSGVFPQALSDAIAEAAAEGILNVFAAGNDGVDIDTYKFDPATVGSSTGLVVAASDQQDNRVGFSNYGRSTVHVAAPGVSILSTAGGSYQYSSGTSMATPHVAGAAALVMAARPELTPAQVKSVLTDNVEQLGAWSTLVSSGGRLNVHYALIAGTPNLSPLIQVTSPAAGARFTTQDSIAVRAAASDPDGSIAIVEFFANGAAIGSDSTAPYEATWRPFDTGDYTLTATATDNLGRTATSGGVSVGVDPAPGSATATFVKMDSTTQGNWRGVYGGQGYVLSNDAVNLAPGMSVTPAGHLAYTWASSTTDPRALQKPSGSDRIASTWYTYSSYTIDVDPGDALPHRLAIYGLDWDNGGRTQTVQVLDASSGSVLDTRTLSQMAIGRYWVWNITGRVRLRVTFVGGLNASLSGVFLDAVGAPANAPPTVTLTQPSPGERFLAPATLTLAADAGDADGTVRDVTFLANGAPVGTDSTAPYSVAWSGVAAGAYTLTAVATDNLGQATTSASVGIHVDATGGTATALFVRADSTTRGNWRQAYGREGHVLVEHATSLPAGISISASGHLPWTWAPSTTDTRALEKPAGSDRIAATWYTSGTYSIDVVLADGQPHYLSLYGLDWEAANRAQTVELLDAATGTLLDSRTMNNMAGGQYWTWHASGHIRIRVTRTGGLNAVLSGIFIDPVGAAANTPPTVSLTNPSNGATFTLPGAIPLAADAADSDGSIRDVVFQVNGTPVSTDASGPYAATWTPSAPGTYTLTAVATDNLGLAATSPAITIVVQGSAGSGTAAFLQTDALTKGDWRGVYGSSGFVLMAHAVSLPAGVSVTASGHDGVTWTPSTADGRVLLKPTGTDRVASTWYTSTSYVIDVNPGDTQPRRLALYALDWDRRTRAQRVEILNSNGQVLDTRDLTQFEEGRYWVWLVSGDIRLRVTRTGGLNAVLSGLFLDPQ